jgi:multisubunit Na+/H+ antiporter MnhG subunit
MTADARLAREDGTIVRDPQSRVPIRTIACTIGMVLLTAAVLLLGWEVRRVLTWILVAALLAIILGPLVDIAQRRAPTTAQGHRRDPQAPGKHGHQQVLAAVSRLADYPDRTTTVAPSTTTAEPRSAPPLSISAKPTAEALLPGKRRARLGCNRSPVSGHLQYMRSSSVEAEARSHFERLVAGHYGELLRFAQRRVGAPPALPAG